MQALFLDPNAYDKDKAIPIWIGTSSLLIGINL